MSAKKILWMEEDQAIIGTVAPIFRKEGWEVYTANSVEGGYLMLERIKPDLIILAIILGRENGFLAVQDFKSNPELSKVPIIIFSSVTHRWKETTATRRDALETEAEEFIDKSLGPNALIAAIHKYLDD